VVAAGPNSFPTIKMRAHKKMLVLVASLLFQSDVADAVRIINAAYTIIFSNNKIPIMHLTPKVVNQF